MPGTNKTAGGVEGAGAVLYTAREVGNDEEACTVFVVRKTLETANSTTAVADADPVS